MLGALFAFASAAFFGLNNAAARRGMLSATALQGMAITVPLGVPVFFAIALGFGGFPVMAGWDFSPWFWMTLAGIAHFVVGRYGNYRATKLLGSNLSAPVQQLSILVALILGFTFLGETVNSVNVLGIALVLFSPMVLVRRQAAIAEAGRGKGFEPQYLPGIVWGVVCALGYGTSPLFIALGLGADGGLADGVAGGLVSYGAATILVVVMVIAVGGRSYMADLDRGSGFWFLLSALFVALSQVFRYLALAIAPVSVVVPIQRLSIVFRILFNALINRDHEIFDIWVIASILLAAVGVVAVAAETAPLLDWLSLGGPIAEFLATDLF